MSAHLDIAILDVDGTLKPGALGIELLGALLEAGVCDPKPVDAVLEVLSEHRGGQVEFSTMAARAYSAYARALAGREVSTVEQLAREVWAERRAELFAFVPELISTLRAHGFELMLISGSPIEIVRPVADEFEIAAAHGAVFGREEGRYTGTVALSSGVPGEKAKIFAAATRGRELCVERCFALGDSITDAALFERVGLALAFEPGPELAALASERGWATATRDDVVARTRALLSSLSPSNRPI
ncbi:haloacid dehalogenase-like hydrolase [Enhygromyxa salina]|uniref:Haloacid dehalogenase-like hydrolase n=1 Tax=Enhygromyxa salina TaxID=215803 RepID=A0A2S9XYC6_9BACT|nr:HAD-IB family phosphatase [Enhygromyxa salina]PRP97862.1 haloacid dehalogenase-like hydrolase [Enhygromyxa salina]